MGKPAARFGDMTAHGGTVAGPGCPTVLSGGMPATRIGDMHVCPMMSARILHQIQIESSFAVNVMVIQRYS